MNNLFQFLACISACIATIAIVLIGADLFSSIRTEKEEKTQTDDVKKNIPILFRIFLPRRYEVKCRRLPEKGRGKGRRGSARGGCCLQKQKAFRMDNAEGCKGENKKKQ